jgi:hypothetical protein
VVGDREALRLRAWFQRRDHHLEQLMADRGIISSREVARCDWEAMVAEAERGAGPRPSSWLDRPGTGTTGRLRTHWTLSEQR